MNSSERKLFYREASLVYLLGLGCLLTANTLHGAVDPLALYKSPSYEIRLNLNEYSVFSAAEVDGLLKYGGTGDFHLTMAKDGSDVMWKVTINSQRQMELLRIYLGEEAIKLIPSSDPSSFDSKARLTLAAAKSLGAKLDSAQENPVWDPVKLSGLVGQNGTNWVIEGKEGKFSLVGEKLTFLQGAVGKPVLAEGFVKKPGQFEVMHFMEQKTNTLELFVMSHCPFGQKAETELLDYLDNTTATPRPQFEPHYIFYKQRKGENDVFVSMHGDGEISEDLVQMVIRDKYPTHLPKYLRFRAASGDRPWAELANLAGLEKAQIDDVENIIKANRVSLIEKEYNYAIQHGVTDGSPTYVWESERVPDIAKIDKFKGLTASRDGGCSQ